ncbi:MAG: adenylate kinase [Clostridia bacterium]
MRIVLLGAPGSGKGTQAELLEKKFGIPQISTGNILRKNIVDKTPLGLAAKHYLDDGQLVPDKIVIDIIRNRIKVKDCKSGFILDGFPRTLEQGMALEKMIKIDVVIYLDVLEHDIERRIISRRICPNCHKVFSLLNYFETKCDDCGAELIQRDDDKLEVIRNRIDTYNRDTAPLIKYYIKSKKLERIIGSDSAEDVNNCIIESLKRR